MVEKTLSNEFKVRLPWSTQNLWEDENEKWNETCAWALEKFGLPGHRFSTVCTEDYMDFYFQDEKDAIFFSLRWL